ncbi:MAG TPA: hypothetical protein VMF61_08575 [Candidatus Acidoferrales bacterium]|nr:hypothetical protein [Candidatus Acidoferrales bacterium]
MLHALLAVLLLAQATPPPTPPALASPMPSEAPAPAASPSPTASPAPGISPTPPGPHLTLSVQTLQLNPAQQQTVLVSGASPPLSVTSEQKLVTASADPDATSVTIAATQATGSDVVHLVDANGATADISVRVAFDAGTISPQATLLVTGSPADPAWLAAQVGALVGRLTRAMPGTQATIGTPAPPASPLLPGVQTQFSVPVSVTSPDDRYFNVNGTTSVNVQNVAVEPFQPSLLFYDDDPEHVESDGVLFRGTIAAAQPTRLYYYHDDGADPRRIVVMLSTAAAAPTRVQVIDATAGPNMDVMTVGNAVTREYLELQPREEGLIFDLTSSAPLTLHDVPLTSKQLVAGSVDLRVLEGGPVVVTVMAVSPGVDPVTMLDAPLVPGDGHHRTGVFALADYGSETLNYAAGGPDAQTVIGQTTPPLADPTAAPSSDPQGDPRQGGHDYGDYGVLHQIAATLSNPLDTPADAWIYLKPTAGVDRATFLVDGGLVQLGCVRVPTPYQVAAFTLAPHQSYLVQVETMTDGGSFYPVEVGVTGSAPQPTAPPISAPDGCFPKPEPEASTPPPSPASSPSPGAPTPSPEPSP